MLKCFFKELFGGIPFGLYITDSSIQAIQLKCTPGAPQIKAIGERELPSGMVQSGIIVDGKGLAKEIKALLASTTPQPITSKKCVVALPESQVYEHIFYIPSTFDGKAFEEYLNRVVGETIPLDATQLKFNYYVSPYGQTKVVFVAAIQRLILDQYHETIKEFCDLKPVIFEPESLSLLRNIPINLEIDSGLIVIDIKQDSLNWLVTWSEDIFDSSSIPKFGFDKNANNFIGDVKKSIESFAKLTGRKVENIVISEKPDDIPGLQDILKKGLELPITIVDKYKLTAPGADADKFKMAAGLALKGAGVKDLKTSINLLKDTH